MRVVVHTPRVFAETWDIAGLPLAASSADILHAIRGAGAGVLARRVRAENVDTGTPFVYSRGETGLAEAGRRFAAARAEADRAAEAAREPALAALEAGASERQVAAELGVDRHTLRAWLGKPRGRS